MWAAGSPPVSAVSQYVETIPTSDSSSTPGVGKTTKAKLPTKIQATVDAEAQEDASSLTTIATSSAYGAPTSSLRRPRPTQQQPPRRESKPPPPRRDEPDAPVRTPLRSAFEAVGSGSDARIVALIIVLGLTTAGAVLVSALDRRRSA